MGTQFWRRAIALAVGGGLFSVTGAAGAQNIALDGTLGTTAPVPTFTTLNYPTVYDIRQELGQTIGTNLFHSFGRFNLTATEAAFFRSDPTIRNIFSRVTGGSLSSIDGLIATQSSNVNLFLINPSGILFGPNAQLDIGSATRGSFVATTVDAITFRNGSQFSATNPGNAADLLTIVGDPSGFLATQRSPQPIVIKNAALNIASGQSLLFLGGNITVDTSSLAVNFPQGGRIELGGISEAGTVGLTIQGNDLQLNFPYGLARADITTNRTDILVDANNAGSIAIYSRNLDILNSRFLAGIVENLGTSTSQAGDIIFNASAKIVLKKSAIGNLVDINATGNGGNISIKANSLQVIDSSGIGAITVGNGNAGKVLVQVEEVISLHNSILSGAVERGGVGNGGDISINASQLSLQDSQIVASTGGRGNAGRIFIQTQGAVSLIETDAVFNEDFFVSTPLSTVISSSIIPGGVGNSGGVSINAGSLSITGGAQLLTIVRRPFSALPSGQGNAGNIDIDVRDAITISGIRTENQTTGGIASAVDQRALGKGGDINIKASSLALSNAFINSGLDPQAVGQAGNISVQVQSLSVTNGGQIQAITRGQGDAGNILIQASDVVFLDGFVPGGGEPSGVLTSVERNSTGNGGNIRVETGLLSITNGAQLISSTRGQGDAGNIWIDVRDHIILDGTSSDGTLSSGIFSNVERIAVGRGGDIRLNTPSLKISQDAQLSSSSSGVGSAGSMDITARTIQLNQGAITARSASGNGGNITLNVQDLLLLRFGSDISTTAGTAQSEGNGGNITINVPKGFIVGVKRENSDITANAFSGSGGRVNITAQGIYGLQFRPQLTPFSDITASSTFGLSGTVTLNTPDLDPSRGLQQLPVDLVDPSQQIVQTCVPRGLARTSSFTVTGRGGLPESPLDPLQSGTDEAGWVTVDRNGANQGGRAQGWKGERGEAKKEERVNTPSEPISEATGWVIGKDGEVFLVANGAIADQQGIWQRSLTCAPGLK